MTRSRLLATCVAAGLSLADLPCARAQATTGQEQHRLEILAARAPLALSGDGAWRLHVDSHDVLHRAGLADAPRESTVQLPPGVQAIAASADGRRVALSTIRQCTGLVDFGAHDGDTPVVSWRPMRVAGNGLAMGGLPGPWVAPMPADCGAHEPAPPVAISSDGRWVATPESVVEPATGQVVAALPSDDAATLQLQFLDHDTRLLVARAHLGESSNGPGGPSSLGFSTWDMATKALVNHVEVSDARLGSRASLLLDVSPQTDAVFFVDERAGLALTQLAPGTCGAAPRVRSRVGEDIGPAFAVDPYGRWLAWARPLDAKANQAEWDVGLRSELVVKDTAGDRVLARTTSRFVLAGLVATPDGRGVLALGSHAFDPDTGERVDGAAAIPDADQLVRIDLGDAIAALPKDAANAPAAGYCREPGEAPGARAQARTERLLQPLWSHDMTADALAAPLPEEAAACFDAETRMTSFRTADGGLWVDQGAQVVRLDPATGAVAQSLPTPRKKDVCSVVSGAGSGFFNTSGDTLTWRPLAAATDQARRRVLEHRTGWTATQLATRDTGARVVWQANAATIAAREAAGETRHVVVADYDAKGKRVHEFAATTADPGQIAREEAPAELPAPCHAANGTPIAIGYDWRTGPFGSWRGLTCGPLPGTARLIWWGGASIAPRTAGVPILKPAIDGAIGVIDDGQQLHVVNLALQREFAQVAFNGTPRDDVWVLASRRLLVLPVLAYDGHAVLRAYALP